MKSIRAAARIGLVVLASALGFFAYDVRGVQHARAGHGLGPAAAVLEQIYVEVKELGPYPGENFIRREFFLGPADDDSYKKEHICILIQVVDGVERMKIQITEMKTRPDNPRIQLAGQSKAISCAISAKGALTLLRSDYSDSELAGVAPDVLRAVLEKKKLLKEFGPDGILGP